MESIKVEICSLCHPFYTGKQKLVDTARRVEKFQDKLAKKAAMAQARKDNKDKKKTCATKKKSAKEK